jgi:hypothetical protein
MTATLERLEFRFLWNAAEHRRFYDALRRAVMQRGARRWLFPVLIVITALFVVPQLVGHDVTPVTAAFTVAPYVILFAAWVALFRWGMPYIRARAYDDQVRVFSEDGIEARCVTSDVKVQWHGISRVLETPEFFLFFTRPSCAFQLPKRAIPSAEQLDALRDLARRHSHIEQSPDVAQ